MSGGVKSGANLASHAVFNVVLARYIARTDSGASTLPFQFLARLDHWNSTWTKCQSPSAQLPRSQVPSAQVPGEVSIGPQLPATPTATCPGSASRWNATPPNFFLSPLQPSRLGDHDCHHLVTGTAQSNIFDLTNFPNSCRNLYLPARPGEGEGAEGRRHSGTSTNIVTSECRNLRTTTLEEPLFNISSVFPFRVARAAGFVVVHIKSSRVAVRHS